MKASPAARIPSLLARGLSVVLAANLAFGCGAPPQPVAPPSAGAPAPVSDPQSPLTADLASFNAAHELIGSYGQAGKGYLAAAEALPFQDDAGRPTAEFSQADRNQDGKLTEAELAAYFRGLAGPAAGGEVRGESWWLGGLLLGTLAGGYLLYVGHKGANDFLHPSRDKSTTRPRDLGLDAEDVTLKSADGVTLKGWFIPAPVPTATTVLILHGHGGNKSQFLRQMAPWLHQKYNLFTFDFRNSGESGGDTTTLGPLEQQDLRAALDFLEGRGQEQIGALAISMGAATALEVAAQDTRLAAVVSDCSFDTIFNAIHSRVARRHYPLARQGAWMILKFANRRTGLNLEEADPLRTVAQIAPRPLLFIHGTADKSTLPEASQHLFDAAGGPKELWMVPGAGHAKSYETASAEYERRVLAFFAAALPAPAARPVLTSARQP